MTESGNEAARTTQENEVTENPDVLDAMAVYSADGQADDASGNDSGLAQNLPKPGEDDGTVIPQGDRMPHGPS